MKERKITDYHLIVEQETFELQEHVRSEIANGWEPHGMLQIIQPYVNEFGDVYPNFIQPMVKYDD